MATEANGGSSSPSAAERSGDSHTRTIATSGETENRGTYQQQQHRSSSSSSSTKEQSPVPSPSSGNAARSPQSSGGGKARKNEGGASDLTTPLPPCRICGDKASGLHYGANTCEACKGFFRRCLLLRKIEFECPGDGTCKLTARNKAACPACRYRRCTEAGMSQHGSKPGRYTLERKSDYIKEVKQLQKDLVAKRLGVANAERRVYLDHLIDSVTQAHDDNLLHPPAIMSQLSEKQTRYKEMEAIKEECFGPMNPISAEEYDAIYSSTGIDVDGRRETASNTLFPMAEEATRKLIKFTRVLPDFSELHSDDQIALIKACFFEWIVLSTYRAMDVKDNLLTNQEGDTVSKSDMAKSCDPVFIDEFYRVAGLLQKLNLTDIETALLKGICILASDRCELQDPSRVETSQAELIEALQYHVTRTRDPSERLVGRMMSVITEMRTPSYLHSKVKDKLRETLENKMPPLIVEICSK